MLLRMSAYTSKASSAGVLPSAANSALSVSGFIYNHDHIIIAHTAAATATSSSWFSSMVAMGTGWGERGKKEVVSCKSTREDDSGL